MELHVEQRQRRRWRCVACAGVAVVGAAMLTLCSNASRAARGSWEESAIAVDPEALDVARNDSLTVTVSLVYSGAFSTDAVVICTLDAGTVTDTGPDVYLAAADTVTWSGTVTPLETTGLEWWAWPSSWPTMMISCTLDGGHYLSQTMVVTPIVYTFPMVMVGYTPPVKTHVVTVPVTGWGIHSEGESHLEALAPSGVWGMHGGSAIVASIAPWDAGIYYAIDRTALAVTVPDRSEIITAGLSFRPCSRRSGDESWGLLSPPTVTLHLGIWPGWFASKEVMWTSWDYGAILGQFDTTDIYTDECTYAGSRRVVVPLDVQSMKPGQTLKLLIRDSQDDVDLRPLCSGPVSRGILTFDGVWLEIGLASEEGEP